MLIDVNSSYDGHNKTNKSEKISGTFRKKCGVVFTLQFPGRVKFVEYPIKLYYTILKVGNILCPKFVIPDNESLLVGK